MHVVPKGITPVKPVEPTLLDSLKYRLSMGISQPLTHAQDGAKAAYEILKSEALLGGLPVQESLYALPDREPEPSEDCDHRIRRFNQRRRQR